MQAEQLLRDFLTKKMKMTGPYQPVVIRQLLVEGGKSTLESIARTLAALDPVAVEYYLARLKRYPKEVLTKHGIAVFRRDDVEFAFAASLTKEARDALVEICDQKIADFFAQDQEDPGRPAGWGATRVRMITAHPYCALCGARPGSADVTLDIDHIIPVSKGGSDNPENLQVLCHRCNRAKGNSLLVSAKEAHQGRTDARPDCVFCNMPAERKIEVGEAVYVVRDLYPVSEGHTLIIPHRHEQDADRLTDLEFLETLRCAQKVMSDLRSTDSTIGGFNCGYNIGEVAGQSVMHAHFHVIPRRKGDVEDPFGGIRGVIPGKRHYVK